MMSDLRQRLTFALRSVFRQRARSAGTLAAIALGVAGLILAGGVVHVQRLLVGRQAAAVGALEREDLLLDLRAVGLGVVDGAAIVVVFARFP